ncbi:MAG TPA: hypothetical protein VK065_04165 [Brevibacterium sp.]|nr:hypothetical protein [Brevibacterium sp.]
MSVSHSYPIPHRVALAVGLALVRWARSTTRSAAPVRTPTPADRGPALDHETAIRRHHVEREVERGRHAAMRRYLTLPHQP